MPRLNVSNQAEAKLTSAINSSATQMVVDDISKFPAPPFRVTIDNEIIEVGAVTVGTKTMSSLVRGQEGTAASSHVANTPVEHRFTAGMYDDLRVYEDIGESVDYAGVKYRLVMIDGEAFMEVIDNG